MFIQLSRFSNLLGVEFEYDYDRVRIEFEYDYE